MRRESSCSRRAPAERVANRARTAAPHRRCKRRASSSATTALGQSECTERIVSVAPQVSSASVVSHVAEKRYHTSKTVKSEAQLDRSVAL